MARKFILTLAAAVLTACFASAQNYHNAFGVRLGFGAGLTYKSFVSNSAALEGIAAYQIEEKGYTLTLLYEIHNYRALGASHLALVYGLGAHTGYYNGSYYKNRNGIYYEKNAVNVGVDGIFGIDYFVPGPSINWGIDVKPVFDFVNPGFRFWDAALSIRYAF